MVRFHCDVCNVTLGSEKWLEEHKKGKAHQIALAKQEQVKKLADQSVFLNGPKKWSASEDEIRKALGSFGQIDRVIVNKKNAKSAIVEFSSAETVKKLLEQKKVKIGEKQINIKPRMVDFEKKSVEAESLSIINQNDVLKFLQEKLTGNIVEDLQQVYEHYRRNSTQSIEEFVTKLQSYVQEYFQETVQLIIFGSTNIGLATFDADVDLCFISKHHDATASTSNGTNGTTNDIMTQQITDLHKSKISLDAFNALQKTDKVKFLARVFNEFRKEHGLILSIESIPDARCPVVRFIVSNAIKDYPKLPLHFEVSVNNFLGVNKSLFTKNALNRDLSLILFLIRLWGRCFKLFKDPDDPNGHWSSYALSLVFVDFCQLQGYMSKVNICGTETVNGWHVDYKIEELPTFACSLDTFLLEFFKFLATTFNKPVVLSPHYARLYESQDDFKNDFKGKVADEFKFSLVNVQDPIELTHNVTFNISQHYLKTLRGQSMRVICNLKANPENPILALFDKKAQKPETSKASEPKESNPLEPNTAESKPSEPNTAELNEEPSEKRRKIQS